VIVMLKYKDDTICIGVRKRNFDQKYYEIFHDLDQIEIYGYENRDTCELGRDNNA